MENSLHKSEVSSWSHLFKNRNEIRGFVPYIKIMIYGMVTQKDV